MRDQYPRGSPVLVADATATTPATAEKAATAAPDAEPDACQRGGWGRGGVTAGRPDEER
jgi:hypothetical protein